MNALIDERRRLFSQSGEEGIIDRVFRVIGMQNRFCCEFGAWDGIVLSNTRSLILDGWSALLIEGNPEKFRDLQDSYRENPKVVLECSFVDHGANSLDVIMERNGMAHRRLDLLSIDIDGLDFNIFSTLDRLRSLPRLVVVEVPVEHGPFRADLLPNAIAKINIGQPLAAFVNRGRDMGYRLVCHLHCNAFFVADDAGGHVEVPTVSPEEAWKASMAILLKSPADAEYVYLRNHGLEDSPYPFNNPDLSPTLLGIAPERAARIYRKARRRRLMRQLRRRLKHVLGLTPRS